MIYSGHLERLFQFINPPPIDSMWQPALIIRFQSLIIPPCRLSPSFIFHPSLHARHARPFTEPARHARPFTQHARHARPFNRHAWHAYLFTQPALHAWPSPCLFGMPGIHQAFLACLEFTKHALHVHPFTLPDLLSWPSPSLPGMPTPSPSLLYMPGLHQVCPACLPLHPA
jgi:hypothetical protein